MGVIKNSLEVTVFLDAVSHLLNSVVSIRRDVLIDMSNTNVQV